MRRACVIGAALALLAAAGTSAALAGPPPQRIAIVSLFDPIVYGEKGFVNGQLIGDEQGGQPVTLQASLFPFDSWGDIAQTTTDPAGYYSFMRRPIATTRYRTVWNGQVVSEREVQVQVSPRLKFTAFAAGKTSVRFKGALRPAHPDLSIAIERQSSSGSWTTIANARLKGGKTFSGRVRAHRSIRLRAYFASDGDHLAVRTRPVKVTLRRR
jgi:hypothetical protein